MNSTKKNSNGLNLDEENQFLFDAVVMLQGQRDKLFKALLEAEPELHAEGKASPIVKKAIEEVSQETFH
jgi:hypothetical protein